MNSSSVFQCCRKNKVANFPTDCGFVYFSFCSINSIIYFEALLLGIYALRIDSPGKTSSPPSFGNSTLPPCLVSLIG